MRVAGTQRQVVLHVDYEAVLRQAVENERYRVLREVRAEVEGVLATKPSRDQRSWGSEDRSGPEVKRDVLAVIDQIGQRP